MVSDKDIRRLIRLESSTDPGTLAEVVAALSDQLVLLPRQRENSR